MNVCVRYYDVGRGGGGGGGLAMVKGLLQENNTNNDNPFTQLFNQVLTRC